MRKKVVSKLSNIKVKVDDTEMFILLKDLCEKAHVYIHKNLAIKTMSTTDGSSLSNEGIVDIGEWAVEPGEAFSIKAHNNHLICSGDSQFIVKDESGNIAEVEIQDILDKSFTKVLILDGEEFIFVQIDEIERLVDSGAELFYSILLSDESYTPVIHKFA